MKTLAISDGKGELAGTVFPDYGGMLGELAWRGRPVFHLDRTRLHLSSLLAGGCPVLFPFPSLTADDRYLVDGKPYSMPFHGLVKYATFSVAEASSRRVVLYTTGSEVTRESNYPFDFRLELEYAIEDGSTVLLGTAVENRSDAALPHYFGWHPYFHASDKSACGLNLDFGRYFSYDDNAFHEAAETPDLLARTDYVYSERRGDRAEFVNTADGFRVRMVMDDAYEVMTVCTRFDGCVCVEPWMGLPDSIHSGRYLQWVPPHARRNYSLKLMLTEC